MSVDVYGANGEETFFSNGGWAFVLHFAMAYGWQPAGTIPPAGHNARWDGNYDCPEGQSVSAPDAKSLAQAISAGLDAPGRFDVLREIAKRFGSLIGTSVDAPDFTQQKGIEHIKEFVQLARNGAFVIW